MTELHGKVKQMSRQEKINKILQLVADLGWDYDRLSSSGQQTYNDLCDLLGIE